MHSGKLFTQLKKDSPVEEMMILLRGRYLANYLIR